VVSFIGILKYRAQHILKGHLLALQAMDYRPLTMDFYKKTKAAGRLPCAAVASCIVANFLSGHEDSLLMRFFR
jgi:hypothetical protein